MHEDGTTGFYLRLSPAPGVADGSRVLLLHGWLQSSESWLTTAAHLRDGGSEVLVIDWLGHGRSHADPSQLTVEHLELQLEAVIARVGWDTGAAMAVAGVSLGGKVTCSKMYVYRRVISCACVTQGGWQ